MRPADLHVKVELPKYALIRYKSVGFLKAYSVQRTKNYKNKT